MHRVGALAIAPLVGLLVACGGGRPRDAERPAVRSSDEGGEFEYREGAVPAAPAGSDPDDDDDDDDSSGADDDDDEATDAIAKPDGAKPDDDAKPDGSRTEVEVEIDPDASGPPPTSP